MRITERKRRQLKLLSYFFIIQDEKHEQYMGFPFPLPSLGPEINFVSFNELPTNTPDYTISVTFRTPKFDVILFYHRISLIWEGEHFV